MSWDKFDNILAKNHTICMTCIYVTVVVFKIDTLLKGGNIRKYLFKKTFRITSAMGIA